MRSVWWEWRKIRVCMWWKKYKCIRRRYLYEKYFPCLKTLLFIEIGTLIFHVYFYLLAVSQCDYRYHKKENLAVTESSIWRTYVVLTELLCRIGPCMILVTLNILMIRDFKKSIKRRSNLKNTHYKDKRNKAYRWKSHVQYQYKTTGM